MEEYKTRKIVLRKIKDLDVNIIFKGLSNPDVIKHSGVSFCSIEDTKEQMEWFANAKQQWFAICSIDNKEFYGAGGLNDISKEHKKGEMRL
jgi:ribosomal-protein-alanine N-acetyltransferase